MLLISAVKLIVVPSMITGHGWAFSGEMIKKGLRKKKQTDSNYVSHVPICNEQPG